MASLTVVVCSIVSACCYPNSPYLQLECRKRDRLTTVIGGDEDELPIELVDVVEYVVVAGL